MALLCYPKNALEGPYDAMDLNRRTFAKVPEVAAIFWVVKILTTGMGEAASDFLNQRLGPGIAVPLAALALFGALLLQFRADRYIAWVYWLAVAMVAIFGTIAADVLHKGIGIPYAVSTAFFAVVLAAVFVVWHRLEGTLSIHSIHTPQREAFYWLTVVTTFALGTAAGDLTATSVGIGFLASGFLFLGLIAVPAIGFRWFAMNEVLAFWFAYILTRPLGASFADWLAVSPLRGGLGMGPGVVALILSAVIIILVAYLSVARQDIQVEETHGGLGTPTD
jgi:uncharacterized membrane-anchored protein